MVVDIKLSPENAGKRRGFEGNFFVIASAGAFGILNGSFLNNER
jgi:hypothetical protein